MKVTLATSGVATLSLSHEERRCLGDALAVLLIYPSFESLDLPAVIGISREAAECLLRAIRGLPSVAPSTDLILLSERTATGRGRRPAEVRLTATDVSAIRRTMELLMREIEDWEFSALLGFTRAEWRALLDDVSQIERRMRG